MAVKRYLGLDLLRFQFALCEGVLLVDELDGDDGFEGMVRAGLANEGICARSNRAS